MKRVIIVLFVMGTVNLMGMNWPEVQKNTGQHDYWLELNLFTRHDSTFDTTYCPRHTVIDSSLKYDSTLEHFDRKTLPVENYEPKDNSLKIGFCVPVAVLPVI